MSAPLVLDADRFDDLVRRLVDLPWPLDVARAREVVDEWGWTVQEELPAGTLFVDPGYGTTGGRPAAFHANGGVVESVNVAMTDTVADPPPRVARVMLAAYGYFADRIAHTLGAPVIERDEVGFPESVWTLPSGAELVLSRDPETSAVRVLAPAVPEPAPEAEPEPVEVVESADPVDDAATQLLAVAPPEPETDPDPEPAEQDSWAGLDDAVVHTIERLADRSRVVLTYQPEGVRDGDYYVQIAVDGDRLGIEAVADHFLPEGLQLGQRGADRLRSLGWSEPVAAGEWPGNWTIALPFPPPEAELAPLGRLLVFTLRDVFGTPDPHHLVGEAWRDPSPDGTEPRTDLSIAELAEAGVR